MARLLLLSMIFGLITAAYPANIDELLDQYRLDSDLSKQTIDESQGFLTLYTRDDIERMQARRLKDLLKTVRFFKYDENMFGQPDMLHVDPITYMSDPIRVYVNDHEIYSGYVGSGLFLYGDIDLGFVDHVEIYNGASSIEVNTEPALMIVKLYSKEAERENGYRLEATAGSRGSNTQNGSAAYLFETFSMFAYLDRTEAMRETYDHKGHTLSKSYCAHHLFANIETENHHLDLEFYQKRSDPFLSGSMFATPNQGETNIRMGRMALTSYFQERSLVLDLSYWHGNYYSDFHSDGTLWSTNLADLLLQKDHLVSETEDDVGSIKLSKRFHVGEHRLQVGALWRYKAIDMKRQERNGASVLPNKTCYEASIYSAYVQDRYLFDDEQLLIGAAKINRYDNDLYPKAVEKTTYQGRLGYIYNGRGLGLKAFAEHSEFLGEQFLLLSTNLDSDTLVKTDTISFEAKYAAGEQTGAFFVNAGRISSDQISGTLTGIDQDALGVGADYRYDFDSFNKFQAQYFFNYVEDTGYFSRAHGAFARLLNTWGQWDVFNEAVFRVSQDSEIANLTQQPGMKSGVDYSVGLRYRFHPDAVLSVKGTNIFHSAPQSRYLYVDNSDPNPYNWTFDTLYIAPVDREFTVGMEWRF